MIKPILKWAGGKRNIVNLIEERISILDTEESTLFDLFAGSASVAFHLNKRFKLVVINDTNEELYNLYNVIKKDHKNLINKLKYFKENHSKNQFYDVRAWDRTEEYKKKYSNTERAARTVYLNKTCFNGLYRVNSKGEFNVPMGKYKNPMINDFKNIENVSKFLKKDVVLKNHDFYLLKNMIKPGDVVYLDPPYDKENEGSFAEYTKNNFDIYDHERLKDFVDELTDRGVYVILSNSATEKIKKLYKNYLKKSSLIKVRRIVGFRLETRKKVDEILLDNFEKVNQNEIKKS